MMNIKRFFTYLVVLSPVFTFGGTNSSEADYVIVIANAWMSFFHLVDGFKWLLALAPMLLAAWAVGQGRRKLIKDADQTQMSQSGNLSGGTVNVDIIKVYVTYVVGAVISLYIIYGTFGIVYADATSYTQMWDELVMKFWKEVFGV